MHHSSLLLIAALITVSPFAAVAQNAPQVKAQPTPQASDPQSSALLRFNLDFPGGTPGALVAAISKAMGKHLNVIIPTSHADTKIMPVKVEGVTVPQLFAAIQTASRRDVPMVTGRAGGQKNITFRTVGIDFGIAGGDALNNETVWSFTSTEPTPEDTAVLSMTNEPEQVCQYFQLAPYLQDHTVEDITTAIQTGWKMLKVDPVPQLSFHQETKLLIAVGATPYVAQIPQVLQQLPLDNSATVDRITKWQAELDDIETKKAADWEKQAQTLREKIERLARVQRARETIQNPSQPGVPRPPSVPGRSITR